PYLILKWAETADGFIAPLSTSERQPVWISNQYSRQLVHKWRSEEQAILIGTKTAMSDNPRLDVRDWDKKNQPIRLVIDKTGKIPTQSHIFDNEQLTIVFSQDVPTFVRKNVVFEAIDFSQNILPQILEVLHRRQILSVIVEGGSHTLQAFIDENLWDEARIFVGNENFGNGIKAPGINRKNVQRLLVDNDELLIFRNV